MPVREPIIPQLVTGSTKEVLTQLRLTFEAYQAAASGELVARDGTPFTAAKLTDRTRTYSNGLYNGVTAFWLKIQHVERSGENAFLTPLFENVRSQMQKMVEDFGRGVTYGRAINDHQPTPEPHLRKVDNNRNGYRQSEPLIVMAMERVPFDTDYSRFSPESFCKYQTYAEAVALLFEPTEQHRLYEFAFDNRVFTRQEFFNEAIQNTRLQQGEFYRRHFINTILNKIEWPITNSATQNAQAIGTIWRAASNRMPMPDDIAGAIVHEAGRRHIELSGEAQIVSESLSRSEGPSLSN